MFNILLSVQIILSMLLGGRGTLWGPVLGAFIVEPLNEISNNELGGGNTRLLMFGGLIALIVLFVPSGILPDGQGVDRERRTRGKAGEVGERLDRGLTCASGRRRATARRARGAVCSWSRGLAKRFGGLRAVDGCFLRGRAGLDHRADRPNGSGKTTVFNLDRRDDAGKRRLR